MSILQYFQLNHKSNFMSMNFRQLVILFAFLCFSWNLSGQFGVSTEFRHYPLSDWEEIIGDNVHDVNFGISLDYWTRLKNYRWEMIPTLSGSFSPGTSSSEGQQLEYGLTTYRFQLKNNIYLLDFKNDCNCPTFSKQSGWFKKSFYLQLAPGYTYNRLAITILPDDKIVNGKHVFEMGIGAGFDIGLSDLVTISPYANYVIGTNFEHPYLFSPGPLTTNLNHIVVGVRLGLRPDYARPKSMRRRNLRY